MRSKPPAPVPSCKQAHADHGGRPLPRRCGADGAARPRQRPAPSGAAAAGQSCGRLQPAAISVAGGDRRGWMEDIEMRTRRRRRPASVGLVVGAGLFSLILAAIPAAKPCAAMGAEARIGAPAPNFTLSDSNGKTVFLAAFKGKTIVLEWSNHVCPYVRKHYGGNSVPALQEKWTAQGSVWLTLISSHPGAQGFVHGLSRRPSSPWREARHRRPCSSTPRGRSAI